MTALAERDGRRVFGLELHVDYWDHLGWVDPFSSPAHSARQRAYAKRLGAGGVYTPQMVVNGREELVGSRAVAAQNAIARALATSAPVGVVLRATRVTGPPTSIRVDYTVLPSEGVDLNLGVALDAAETRVTRGENANHVLPHRHVVLAFDTRRVAAAGSGTWLAPWPASAGGARAFVVAYASDPVTLAVLGAESAVVPAVD